MTSSESESCEVEYKSVRIVAATAASPPFQVSAVAAEEDTSLLLSLDPQIHEPPESYQNLISQALREAPRKPGTVLVKGGFPLILLAVVHDLERDPTWHAEWILDALQGILHEVEVRRLEAIALPLLGSVHGSLGPAQSVELLRQALDRAGPRHLGRIWLIAPQGTRCHVLDPLARALEQHAE